MDRVKASEVVFDERFYPRVNDDPVWIALLAERLQAGQSLPPIVVCKETRVLLDGKHRLEAHRKVGGADCEVPVVWVSPRTDAERFRLALEYNAKHGRPLSTIDYVEATLRAELHGLTPAEVAQILGLRREYLEQVVDRRVAYSETGEPVVLGRSWEFMAKQTLPEPVIQVIRRSEGRRLDQLASHLAALVSNAPDELIERYHDTLQNLIYILQRRLSEVS